jgi:hypothetical protein
VKRQAQHQFSQSAGLLELYWSYVGCKTSDMGLEPELKMHLASYISLTSRQDTAFAELQIAKLENPCNRAVTTSREHAYMHVHDRLLGYRQPDKVEMPAVDP